MSLERLRETLDLVSVNMDSYSPLPSRIYVFRNNTTFQPYKLGEDGKSKRIAGYFSATSDGYFIALDASAGREPDRVIFHEYVHSWLETNVPNVPLWLDEGLAEFFSTFETDNNEAVIGVPIVEHLLWLKKHGMIPLERLFKLDRSSSEYNEGHRVGTVYAQSWALVHYMLSGDKDRIEKTGRFLTQIAAHQDPTEAFKEIFETDLASLEKELQAYVRNRKFRHLVFTFKEPLESRESHSKPLEYKEVLFLLGDLLAHRHPVQFEAAKEHLNAALTLDGSHVDALATMGMLAALEEKDEEAKQYFNKAIGLDPERARTHWLYGYSLVQRFSRPLIESDFFLTETTDPMLLEARKHLKQSLKLSPDYPPLLRLLDRPTSSRSTRSKESRCWPKPSRRCLHARTFLSI